MNKPSTNQTPAQAATTQIIRAKLDSRRVREGLAEQESYDLRMSTLEQAINAHALELEEVNDRLRALEKKPQAASRL